MTDSEDKTALGLEYFCDEGDDFWKMDDKELIKFGLDETEELGLIKSRDYIDGFVARIPKAYPVYDGNYMENMKTIRDFLDKFQNLQTIGRGGMFRYNNMDHSILAGLWAAGNVLGERNNPWEIND